MALNVKKTDRYPTRPEGAVDGNQAADRTFLTGVGITGQLRFKIRLAIIAEGENGTPHGFDVIGHASSGTDSPIACARLLFVLAIAERPSPTQQTLVVAGSRCKEFRQSKGLQPS